MFLRFGVVFTDFFEITIYVIQWINVFLHKLLNWYEIFLEQDQYQLKFCTFAKKISTYESRNFSILFRHLQCWVYNTFWSLMKILRRSKFYETKSVETNKFSIIRLRTIFLFFYFFFAFFFSYWSKRSQFKRFNDHTMCAVYR